MISESTTHIASGLVMSSELNEWLDRRNTLKALKTKYQNNPNYFSLLPEPVDPQTLPEPLRSEALKYLHINEKERPTTREAFLKAFQLKVKYI